MTNHDRDESGTPTQAGDLPPSRSQRKREAADVADLGRRLTELEPERLDSLELDSELREALEASRPLRWAALNRQRKWIAKLLRVRDCEAIALLLDRAPAAPVEKTEEESIAVDWRERIIRGSDRVLQEFLIAYPGGDRQQLRQLVRSARQEPESKRGRRARRELLKALAEAMQGEES